MVILLHPSLNSYPSSHLSLILPILSLYSLRSHSPNIPSPSPDAPSLPCGGRDARQPVARRSRPEARAASAAEARPASAAAGGVASAEEARGRRARRRPASVAEAPPASATADGAASAVEACGRRARRRLAASDCNGGLCARCGGRRRVPGSRRPATGMGLGQY